MSTAPEQLDSKPVTPTARMMIVLSGIAMLSGFLVVLTSQLTAPRIAENQRQAIERAHSAVAEILQLAPLFRDFEPVVLDDSPTRVPRKHGVDATQRGYVVALGDDPLDVVGEDVNDRLSLEVRRAPAVDDCQCLGLHAGSLRPRARLPLVRSAAATVDSSCSKD